MEDQEQNGPNLGMGCFTLLGCGFVIGCIFAFGPIMLGWLLIIPAAIAVKKIGMPEG